MHKRASPYYRLDACYSKKHVVILPDLFSGMFSTDGVVLLNIGNSLLTEEEAGSAAGRCAVGERDRGKKGHCGGTSSCVTLS